MLRRSSTTRNLGGHQTDDDDDEGSFDMRRISSVGILDDEEIKKKAEQDRHVADYVAERLRRLNTNGNAMGTEAIEDEVETTTNGNSEFAVYSP